jgi:hypothetical protein
MARAYVGDGGDGRFSAYVDCDEDGPFSFVHGPTGVGPDEAIASARRRAERVTVRLGVDFYTAGSEAVRDLPSWLGHDDDRKLPSDPAADLSDWQVRGARGGFETMPRKLPERAPGGSTTTPARPTWPIG